MIIFEILKAVGVGILAVIALLAIPYGLASFICIYEWAVKKAGSEEGGLMLLFCVILFLMGFLWQLKNAGVLQ